MSNVVPFLGDLALILLALGVALVALHRSMRRWRDARHAAAQRRRRQLERTIDDRVERALRSFSAEPGNWDRGKPNLRVILREERAAHAMREAR